MPISSMPPDTRVRPGETPQPDAGGFPGDAPASLARGDGRRTYSVRVSTAAQHQRDHAAAYAGRIRKVILPWPSVAVCAVLSRPAIDGVAAAVVILVHEFRPEGGVR